MSKLFVKGDRVKLTTGHAPQEVADTFYSEERGEQMILAVYCGDQKTHPARYRRASDYERLKKDEDIFMLNELEEDVVYRMVAYPESRYVFSKGVLYFIMKDRIGRQPAITSWTNFSRGFTLE